MVVLQAGEVTRPTFWQISSVEKALFYGLAVITILVLLVGVYQRFARYSRGEEDAFARLNDIGSRIVAAAKIVASNEKQFDRDFVGGLMHSFILWGFLVLFIGTSILSFDKQLWQRLGNDTLYQGTFFLSYSFVMDLFGLLFVVGLGVAMYRRYVVQHHRLWGKHTGREDDLLLWSLFLLGVGGFVLTGLRIVGQDLVGFSQSSFVGYFLAIVFSSVGVSESLAATVYPIFWWSHALLAFAFLAWLPQAKPFHMISSFANVVTRDDRAGSRLPGVPADASPEEIGPSDIDDFSWKQLLDQDACTKCGRCSSVCPAKAAGRPLDPRDVILDLKQYREDREAGRAEDVPIIADGGTSVIDSRTMESCLTCMACMDACPVEIEHLTHFTEMNRRLTESGQMNQNVEETVMDVFQQGNTLGDPERARPDWTEELDFEVPDARDEPVEYLWYVGDYPSYDGRNQELAKSLATIFEEADVDYGILYEAEQNDGNDIRRVGEEGLYEMLVEDNASAINDCEFDQIVCTDPHSFNTFKNEYPEFDEPDWEREDVNHYSQVVSGLIADGALPLPDSLDDTVTFHDPCHLGRYNGEYDAPRDIVEATGVDLQEMPRNRENSFCCGGGGGGLWMDFDEDPKPSEERLREAVEDTDGSDVERFVVSCPMCVTMFEDGRKTGDFEDQLDVVDVTELVVEALDAEGGTAAS